MDTKKCTHLYSIEMEAEVVNLLKPLRRLHVVRVALDLYLARYLEVVLLLADEGFVDL